jgi:hypothetical protein
MTSIAMKDSTVLCVVNAYCDYLDLEYARQLPHYCVEMMWNQKD